MAMAGWDASFENDVKMYGTQTTALLYISTPQFENDVKMYGTQTREINIMIVQ